MPIKQSIEKDLKTALLSGDKEKATVLRGLKSVILNAEISQNKRDTCLDDETITTLLSKEVKSRIESAELYSQGGSPDRAQKELAEKNIIESYLPAQLSDQELLNFIVEAVAQTQATSMADMGKVIGLVKSQVGGQADGSRIARLVKEQLS